MNDAARTLGFRRESDGLLGVMRGAIQKKVDSFRLFFPSKLCDDPFRYNHTHGSAIGRSRKANNRATSGERTNYRRQSSVGFWQNLLVQYCWPWRSYVAEWISVSRCCLVVCGE